ncbi:MAG: phenylalanine--tRNA ligase subunit alpha [Myxococcales bacterium]|nr:phenylalanine--tRNA ligase subunit alpha [Myxococcales bacterium]
MKLPQHEYEVMQRLATIGPASEALEEVCEATGLDQVHVTVAASMLAGRGWLSLDESSFVELRLGKVGAELAESGFPERSSLRAIAAAGGRLPIAKLAEAPGLDKKSAGESIKHLATKGWAERDKGELGLTEAGRAALDVPSVDERLVALLREMDRATTLDELEGAADFPLEQALALLRGRRDVLSEKKRTRRRLSLTAEGRERWAAGIEPLIEVTQLTSELLIGGKWREVELKRYDVALDVAPQYGGKPHPFRRVLDETRDVFLQMGFSEVDSPHVESAFWDFDALFQPQDHPAREMQDTFYLGRPSRTILPAKHLVETVKDTHETGGESGSLGWQYRWQLDKAQKAVLRTHTTAATIRALADDPSGPRKVFCVGRVFRREAIDYKHLPVFYQVDGIIVDENGTFADLLGTLSAFYRKMGFEKFDFRPAFFPYTEPSVEVFVWMEQRKDWVEMGGAGIFRPEVTIPFGCHAPVLAWGLGLERLAMFRFELDDIRQIYQSDVKWLREVPLCR